MDSGFVGLPPVVWWLIAATVLVVVSGEAWARRSRRSRSAQYGLDFTTAEAQAAAKAIENFKIGVLVEDRASPAWFVRGQEAVDRSNEAAAALQQRYRACVSRCLAALLMAALFTVVSALPLRELKEAKLIATAFDVTAVVYSAVWYVVARITLHRWVAARAHAEFMRSFLHLNLVYQIAPTDPDDFAKSLREYDLSLGAQLEPRQRATFRYRDQSVGDRRIGATVANIAAVWNGLYEKAKAAGAKPMLSLDDIGIYLRERVISEIAFFAASLHRLHQSEQSRTRSMTVLYILSIGIALLKFVAVFDLEGAIRPQSVNPTARMVLDWVTTVFIVLLVLSAAITSGVTSSNERGLAHRYSAQQRRLLAWLEDTKSMLLSLATSASHISDHSFAPRSLAFEKLMIEELTDFAAITLGDSIELPQ